MKKFYCITFVPRNNWEGEHETRTVLVKATDILDALDQITPKGEHLPLVIHVFCEDIG